MKKSFKTYLEEGSKTSGIPIGKVEGINKLINKVIELNLTLDVSTLDKKSIRISNEIEDILKSIGIDPRIKNFKGF